MLRGIEAETEKLLENESLGTYQPGVHMHRGIGDPTRRMSVHVVIKVYPVWVPEGPTWTKYRIGTEGTPMECFISTERCLGNLALGKPDTRLIYPLW